MLQNQNARKLLLGEEARDHMRAAGKFNAQLMDQLREIIQPGTTTEAIDKLVHSYTLDHGHTPATLGYLGYPKSCCTSVTACRRAGSPTKVSPLSVNATMLGVRRFPSRLAITFASPPSMMETTEFVVPKSIPMIFSAKTD